MTGASPVTQDEELVPLLYEAATQITALLKERNELREALEEIAAEVVVHPRNLDEAFSQREALRDIARAALKASEQEKS